MCTQKMRALSYIEAEKITYRVASLLQKNIFLLNISGTLEIKASLFVHFREALGGKIKPNIKLHYYLELSLKVTKSLQHNYSSNKDDNIHEKRSTLKILEKYFINRKLKKRVQK